MAHPKSGAETSLLTPAAITRAERFTRERFVYEGEATADALAPGSPRRRALDAALAELAAKAKAPSVAWRREFSLLLGLERLLSEDEPKLVDGTLLSPHQVDALSGTLTALMAEVQRLSASAAASNGKANGAAPAEPFELASAAIPGEEELEDEEGDEDDEPLDWEEENAGEEDAQLPEQAEDPNAARRFWFEHATGAGKTVAALGFVEASRTGGTLILTHRRNLVDQFNGELRDRGYADRISPALLDGADSAQGVVTVETYQWFVRNSARVSDAYAIVICDEAHTALGEKTSASIRNWSGPIFVGMTATGALIARHVTDLFPTQTSRFDLAQAARRGVIAPLRCVRIPPGPGVRTIAKVPLRRGEVDTEFDQEMLAELLDQQPFNMAIADLYNTRFHGVPGVVYSAGVRHAHNVAAAFRDLEVKAMAVSGDTPKRELARILADFEAGKIDVLVNAMLLAEGWNSPRATICMHLAPTASKRIYQQRVGRVTRRHPGKEAGIVIDFVHPATKHDDPVVTLHSLLDRDVYRGGAIVVGPVRRGRGRRLRVERRVLPVTPDPDRRAEVFERELWRIAVEHLDYGEQHVWAALAGARVTATGWRRAKAMLHFDRVGELRRRFLLEAVKRNKNAALRLRALQEISALRDAEAFDLAIDEIGGWPRDERREGVKVMLQALAEKRIGRRDQANAWIWRMAEYTREVHEEYAVQRWPETKRLLGLLVNSSGHAHARNARRIVQSARKQDRRLCAALLAAALAHTPEAQQALDGARTRMSRKPSALARELLRNFPKGKRSKRRRRRKGPEVGAGAGAGAVLAVLADDALDVDLLDEPVDDAIDDDDDLDDPIDDDSLDDDDLLDDPDADDEDEDDDGPSAEAGTSARAGKAGEAGPGRRSRAAAADDAAPARPPRRRSASRRRRRSPGVLDADTGRSEPSAEPSPVAAEAGEAVESAARGAPKAITGERNPAARSATMTTAGAASKPAAPTTPKPTPAVDAASKPAAPTTPKPTPADAASKPAARTTPRPTPADVPEPPTVPKRKPQPKRQARPRRASDELAAAAAEQVAAAARGADHTDGPPESPGSGESRTEAA